MEIRATSRKIRQLRSYLSTLAGGDGTNCRVKPHTPIRLRGIESNKRKVRPGTRREGSEG